MYYNLCVTVCQWLYVGTAPSPTEPWGEWRAGICSHSFSRFVRARSCELDSGSRGLTSWFDLVSGVHEAIAD